MASRRKVQLDTLQHGMTMIVGTYRIPSDSLNRGSPLILTTTGSGQSVGFRSGSASGVAGIYTASLGNSSSRVDLDNDFYIGGTHFIGATVRSEVSGSSFNRALPNVRILQDRVADLGHIMYCTTVLSSTVSASQTNDAGAVYETIARPNQNIFVDFLVIAKNSDTR